MKQITSLQNDEVKLVVQLCKESRERHSQKLFVAEGLRTCSTLIESNVRLVQLYCVYNQVDKIESLCDEEFVTVVSEAVMNKMSPSTSPSGILAVFEMPEPKKELSTGIVLAQIADPGNMGTLIRTCAAMGKKTLVIVEGTDVFGPKVIQASAGTIGFVNIIQCTWDELLKLKKEMPFYGLVVEGGKEIAPIKEDHLLVIGNEAHGIPTDWQENCDQLITLSMPGKTESLNAAIAGSIAMYVGWAQ